MSLIATDGAGTRTTTPVTVTPIVVIEPDANPTYGQSAAINSMVTAGLPTNPPPSASIIQATTVPFTPTVTPQVNNSIATMSATTPQIAISSGSEPDATPNGIPMTPISTLVASGAMSQPSTSSPQSLPMGGGANTNWGATTDTSFVNPPAMTQSTPSSSGYVAVPEPDATPVQSFGSGGAVVLSSGLASSLGVPVGSTITSGTIITPSAADIRDTNNAMMFASSSNNQPLPMGAGFRDASFNSLTDQSSIITPSTKPSFDITQVPIGADGKPDFTAYYAEQDAASVPAIKTITTLVPNEDYYHIGNVNVDASVWNSASDESKFQFLEQQGVIPQGSQFIPGLTSQNIAQLQSQGEDVKGLTPTTWGYYTPTQLQTQQTALAEQGKQVMANFNQNVAISQHNAAIAATNTVSPATQAQINTTMAALDDYKTTSMPSNIAAPAGYNSGVTGYRIQQAVWDGKVSIADLATAGFDTSSLTTTPNETPVSNLPSNIIFPAGYETGVTPYNTQIAGDRGYVPISNIAYGVTPNSPYVNSATGELNRGSGISSNVGTPQITGGTLNVDTGHNGNIFQNIRSDFDEWYHNLSATDSAGAAVKTALLVNTAASGQDPSKGNFVEVYNPNNPNDVQLTNAQMGTISSSVNDSYLPMGVKAINSVPVVGALNTEVYQLQNTNINPHTIEMNALKSEALQGGALIVGGGFGALTGGITTAGEVAATGATEAGLDTGAVQGARIAAQQAGNTIGMTDAQIANATNMGVDLGNSRWGNIPSEISSTTSGIGNIVGKVGNLVGGVLDQYEGEGVVNNAVSQGDSFNRFWDNPVSNRIGGTLSQDVVGSPSIRLTSGGIPSASQGLESDILSGTTGESISVDSLPSSSFSGTNTEGLNISNPKLSISESGDTIGNIPKQQLETEQADALAYQKATGTTQAQIDSTKFPVTGATDNNMYYTSSVDNPSIKLGQVTSSTQPYNQLSFPENYYYSGTNTAENSMFRNPTMTESVTNPTIKMPVMNTGVVTEEPIINPGIVNKTGMPIITSGIVTSTPLVSNMGVFTIPDKTTSPISSNINESINGVNTISSQVQNPTINTIAQTNPTINQQQQDVFATENFVPSTDAIYNAGVNTISTVNPMKDTVTHPQAITDTVFTNTQITNPIVQTITNPIVSTITTTQPQTINQEITNPIPPDEEVYEPTYKTPLPIIPLGGGGSGIGGGGGGGNSGYESPSSLETKSKIKPELTLNLPNPLENKRYKKVLSPEEAIPAGFRRYNGTRTLGGAL